jgi:hypothetical protein
VPAGEKLLPFVDGLLASDPKAPWAQQVTTAGGAMPPEMWAATIACNGSLTPPFEYIDGMRSARKRSLGSSSPAKAALEQALEG